MQINLASEVKIKMKNTGNINQFQLLKLDKKAVSPVVSTVLLISMVVVIALIIFLWFRNINKEALTKFDGTNVEIVCGDVKFDASYSSGNLDIVNSGNVPIYSIKLRILSEGSYETFDLQEIANSDWPEKGLNPGGAFSSGSLNSMIGSSDKVFLIPVLVGMSESGEQKLYTCQEQYEQELVI